MADHGMTKGSELARLLGYNRPEKINLYLRDYNTKPSYEVINDIIIAFQKYNPDWIITGRGPKLKPTPEQMAGIGKRISRWMDAEHIRVDEFAEKTNQHPVFISELLNRENMPVGRDFLIRVLDAFPKLSPLYLAYGEGEMYRVTPAENHGPPSVHVNASPGDTINVTIHLTNTP
jgi:hypothetical protein